MKVLKNIFIIVPAAIFLFSLQLVHAKRIPPKIGSTKIYFSQNKAYSLQVKLLGRPDRSPSECTLKNGEIVLWKKELETTPGIVDISDDGGVFVFANWGRYDEGAFKSISFYNQNGDLLKTVPCQSNTIKNDLWWISKTTLSKNGTHYIVANTYKESSQISLYNVPGKILVWKNITGFAHVDDILISSNGNSILISSFDYRSKDLMVEYLNNTGEILWDFVIKKGYSENKKFTRLSGDGLEFQIFNQHSKTWQSFQNRKNKIHPF